MKRILRFLQPEGQRPEQEKDVWDIAMLDIPINENPIYKTEKLDFRRIFQDGIREEVKQAIYLHLKYEKLGTVKLEMSSLRQFSKYLRDKHSGIQSCAEIDRALLEEYLIHKATNGSSGRGNSNDILYTDQYVDSTQQNKAAPGGILPCPVLSSCLFYRLYGLSDYIPHGVCCLPHHLWRGVRVGTESEARTVMPQGAGQGLYIHTVF